MARILNAWMDAMDDGRPGITEPHPAEQERDQSRAELKRIRGELEDLIEHIQFGTARENMDYGNAVISQLRAILAPTLPHHENTGNAAT
jgi:hypothetical protein